MSLKPIYTIGLVGNRWRMTAHRLTERRELFCGFHYPISVYTDLLGVPEKAKMCKRCFPRAPFTYPRDWPEAA